MPLGSLADHLYDSKSNKEALDWNTRVKIAVGAAKGMEYLHHQADPPVIYRDLKPANILLGDGFHPKLSDFGLARFGPTGDKAHISTRVVGTYGYCAPEYALTGKLTIKSDIFSFGIVLLELITGRQALDDTQTGHMQWLINWIQPLIEDDDIRKIADTRLRGEFLEGSMYKALNLARLCIQRDVTLRPSMSDVVRRLEEIAFDNSQYDKLVELEQSSCKVADDQESDVPTETTKMLMTLDNKALERANAVAEAKIWGENCRRNLGHI